MTKLIALVAVLLLLAAGLWLLLGGDALPDYPITNPQPTGTTIIAFGDSLTAGHGLPREQAYPAQLSALLGVEIINRGVSGDTSADGLQRLERDVLRDDPRIVIVGLGGNDMLRRIPVDQAMDNLDRIVAAIHEAGAMVVLLGVDTPIGATWDSAFRELAIRRGCVFVPNMLGGVFGRDDLMLDQIHPNAEGYAIIAERIAEAMRPHMATTTDETGAEPAMVR